MIAELSVPIPSDQFPSFVSLGVGAAPDHFGSDEYFVGAAPAARIDFEVASLNLLGNWLMVDVTPTGGAWARSASRA